MTDRSGVRPRAPLLWATASVAAAGATTGAGLMYFPMLALSSLIAVGGVVSAFVLIAFRRVLPALFLVSLGVLLAGYAFFGKSVAYLGVAPAYVGELMLLFAAIAAIASGSLSVLLRSGVAWLILAWSLLGAARTLPFLATYGMDAARDAALWGYSAFALAVAVCVFSTRSVPSVTRHYGRWITRFAAWLPVALVMTRLSDTIMLTVPGTEIPLFTMKASDGGVHLAGAAAFVLVGLSAGSRDDTSDRPRVRFVFWSLWLIALICVAALNRAGFVGVASALLVAGTLEPVAIGRRVAAAAGIAILAGGVLVLASAGLGTPPPDASGERSISPRQVVDNVLSIVGRESAGSNLRDTKDWRLDWWRSIVDYTIFGPYFWSGKGFGINLADDDGFQVVLTDAPLRSPHSGHLTVLARMGVPGVLLWGLLQSWFGWSLVRAYLRARSAGALWWARVDLWILSYWAAFLVIASFDVFLEGPMAGIWFWCVIGFGIALVALQHPDVPGGPLSRSGSVDLTRHSDLVEQQAGRY